MSGKTVTLPTGLVVPRVGIWLPESCPDAATKHSPEPGTYLGHEYVARLRLRAGQRQERCSTCGLFAIWTGGRDVPDWPKRPTDPPGDDPEKLRDA